MGRLGDRKGLGQLVREARQARGWTQAELARRVRVTYSYIGQIERGKSGQPSGRVVHAIARELDLDLDDLYEAPGHTYPYLRQLLSDLQEIRRLDPKEYAMTSEAVLLLVRHALDRAHRRTFPSEPTTPNGCSRSEDDGARRGTSS